MAKTYDKTVKLVKRIPNIETTNYFFRSLLAELHPDDQKTVVEHLLDKITVTPTDN